MRKIIFIGVFIFSFLFIVSGIIFFVFINNDKKDDDLTPGEIPQEKRDALVSSLPDISQIAANPSDTFIIKAEDYDKVERGHPFNGTGSMCEHQGAHIHFTNEGAPYNLDVIAPEDGYISFVMDCFTLIENDKFDIGLDFATKDGKPITMIMSIEPFAGEVCQGNPAYFKQYVKVKQGDQVKKGDVLLSFPKPDLNGSSAHIHFNLLQNGGEQSSGEVTQFCPNIFDEKVEKDFQTMIDDTCDGVPYEATFCNEPGLGEDITGL